MNVSVNIPVLLPTFHNLSSLSKIYNLSRISHLHVSTSKTLQFSCIYLCKYHSKGLLALIYFIIMTIKQHAYMSLNALISLIILILCNFNEKKIIHLFKNEIMFNCFVTSIKVCY